MQDAQEIPGPVVSAINETEKVLKFLDAGNVSAAADRRFKIATWAPDAKVALGRVQSSGMLVSAVADAFAATDAALKGADASASRRAANSLLRSLWRASRGLRSKRMPEREGLGTSLRSLQIAVHENDWLEARRSLSEIRQSFAEYREAAGSRCPAAPAEAFAAAFVRLEKTVTRRDPVTCVTAGHELAEAFARLPS